MEDLFQMLSSSARIDKSKRKKKKRPPTTTTTSNNTHKLSAVKSSRDDHDIDSDDDNDNDNDNVSIESNSNSDENSEEPGHTKKKKRKQVNSNRPKKQHSTKKLKQIHQEEINAFRRKMGIRLSSDNKHEIAIGTMSDPISSFKEWSCPTWWANNSGGGSGGGGDSIKSNNNNNNNSTIQLFHKLQTTILQNIEHGHWTEPTPIQMQSLPSLMDRRDIMGCAPTGSGKSGAFILPAIMLAKCSEEIYYNNKNNHNGKNDDDDDYNDDSEQKGGKKKKKKNKKHNNSSNSNSSSSTNLQGQIRTILLAPSRELASQIHREISRLSTNLHGKFHVTLLSKSNAGLATSNQLGGKYYGLDCLVTTPLRLVECIERGMKLQGVRLIVLDEADRLLDASDGRSGRLDGGKRGTKKGNPNDDDDEEEDDQKDEKSEEEDNANETKQQQQHHHHHHQQSGSSQSRTFLQQIDSILTNIPTSATRALFSATLGPSVRHLSESILRSPIDITTGIHAATGGNSAAGGASEHITQELKFVGREEGKLLAIRQLVTGGITPPVLIFMQSKERAQALFGELLYDGIRVDVIHAGRSHAQRELSVQKFRRGETWVLICTDLVSRGVDFKAVNLVINYDLPPEGVTYVHRIGRTGRAGRPGRAITFFTEADFDNLRTIANVMRLSGCTIPEWMLSMKKTSSSRKVSVVPPRRVDIDTTPRYDRKNNKKRKRQNNNNKKKEQGGAVQRTKSKV